jgi:hypothetical protein
MNNSIRVTPIHHNTPCTIYEKYNSFCSREVMTSKGSYSFQNVKGGINLQEEDTILQYKDRSELSILAPSFHPSIYER